MIKTILFVPVVMIAIVYIVVGLALPQARANNVIKEDNAVKEVELAELEQQKNDVLSYIGQIESNAAASSFLEVFVPEKDAGEQSIINDVAKFAERYEVDMTILSFVGSSENESQRTRRGEENDDVNAPRTRGTMIATGTYENLKKFLSDVHRVKRLNVLESLSMSSIEADDDDGNAVATDLLSLEASFAYPYLASQQPVLGVNDLAMNQPFSVIETIEQNSAQAEALQPQSEPRPNPFRP